MAAEKILPPGLWEQRRGTHYQPISDSPDNYVTRPNERAIMGRKNEGGFRLATRVVHAGQDPDPATGATIPPIYATGRYPQDSPGNHKDY